MSSVSPRRIDAEMRDTLGENAESTPPLAPRRCHQINLQTGVGGGEIYTKFFTQALLALGWQTTLYARRDSWLAANLVMPGVELVAINELAEIPALLPDDGAPIVVHTPFSGATAENIRRGHPLVCFAHMPLYGRKPDVFRHYDLVFAVSAHVITSLKAAGMANYHAEPLYGVADLERPAAPSGQIRAHSVYDWDRRKFRDRCLSHVYPLVFALKSPRTFERREGLTLGIVSRLTPIKQFPLMFEILAPVIRQFPQVNLEIFGSGGYASVRDLERSLTPIAHQVRWWGHQRDVKSIYPQLDFLLTGLPEKEALGLNVIEAQACGTPVLAVNAPPFTETVVEGETGYFFADPRQDRGRDFARLLGQLCAADGRFPDPRQALAHLDKFSFAQFVLRVGRAMDAAAGLAETASCA